MRKRIVFFALVMIFFIPLTLSMSTDMKAIYAPGETMIFYFSGNIVESLSVKQVSFIRTGNVQEVPMVYDLKKLGDKYYLWALASKIAQNYTLIIKDVATTVSGIPKKIEFRQNFSVQGNLTAYSISPGFVISEGEFQMHIQLYRDEPLTISIDFPQKHDIVLAPGDNVIKFPFENVAEAQVKKIGVGSYSIPVYFTQASSIVSSTTSFAFTPTYLSKTFSLKEKNKTITFKVVNTGKEPLKKILITYSSDMFSLSPDETVNLDPGENQTYTLRLLKAEDGIRIQDEISARSGDLNVLLPIKIDFVEKPYENISNVNDSSLLYRCSELGGSLCTTSQHCVGSTNISQEGICCTGTCKEKEKEEGSGSSALGYVLAILVILGLGYLYWKYKKTKPESNPLSKKIKEAEHIP
ncbi:MAG: hypothetical protein AABY00_00165 [Nanoarchaeota archaeon]